MSRYTIALNQAFAREKKELSGKLKPCQGFEGPCDRKDAELVKMRTQYSLQSLNYAILCPECRELADEYWKERWDEYYSMTR